MAGLRPIRAGLPMAEGGGFGRNILIWPADATLFRRRDMDKPRDFGHEDERERREMFEVRFLVSKYSNINVLRTRFD